jgi:DNA polymerase I-like protein with 3'-5' exonuclease and polymerase domains
MQNLPMEFRKYLIADNDCMIFNPDLSQAENRVVAYIAPEPNMMKAFESKTDVHSQTGALISGLPIDEVKRQDDNKEFCTLGNADQTWRFWGKKANHGLNYDLGYKTFAFYYEISDSDGKYIVEKYHRAYPGVRQYHAWIRHQLGKNRTLENLFGRKRLFLDRWGDELFKSAYSFIPQSTVADIINRRGLIYTYYNQDLFRPIDLLLQVHDSMPFQMNYKKYSWEQQAQCLILLKQSLETKLKWHGTEFSIPMGLDVGFNLYKKNMVEVNENEFSSVERLARKLSDIHLQFRASLYV